MSLFVVQSVALEASYTRAFNYIANPQNLPKWTNAFRHVNGTRALMQTPEGSVEVGLETRASAESGTIDWIMTFPDRTREAAYSRLVDSGKGQTIYSFVLLAPGAALETLEGVLEQQSEILKHELERLQQVLREGN
ncbi:MAG: SRPBCC family protein [Acidobacteria bacterium]|nr:SRPBCC family protein [Acidobacteriota bacterium]